MAHHKISEIINNLTPGWFTVVMGTGILALDAHGLGIYWPILDILAEALHWMNTGIFMLLAPMWIFRWLILTKSSLHTLTDPVQADFYPTFSIAMLVLATQWLVFSPTHKTVILVLWWLGAILTFIFSFAVLFFMFLGNHLSMDHITPAKFIPAVGLVVIPLSGSLLLQEMSGVGRDFAFLMNIIGLGSGGMMYTGILSLTLHRAYLYKSVQGIMAPTAWIHLAPIGIIPVSMLNLLEQMPYPVARELALVVMMFVWGFGVWWLIMAILLTIAEAMIRQLPFSLTWWGFIFPLGAFVAEGLRLNQDTGNIGFLWVSAIAGMLLWVLWLITLTKTWIGVRAGRILQSQ